MPDRWTLGINHGSHDAAVALARNGRLKIVVEQERLSRVKRAAGESAADALAECLAQAGLRLSEIELIALGSDHDNLARFLGLSPDERKHILPYDNQERLFPVSLRAGAAGAADNFLPAPPCPCRQCLLAERISGRSHHRLGCHG